MATGKAPPTIDHAGGTLGPLDFGDPTPELMWGVPLAGLVLALTWLVLRRLWRKRRPAG